MLIALEFRRPVPVGKEVGSSEKGKGVMWAVPKGRTLKLGPLSCAFISFLQAGIVGEVSGESFSRIFISSPGVSFQGHDLH